MCARKYTGNSEEKVKRKPEMVMGADQKDVQEIRVEVASEEILENAALEEVHMESGSEKAASLSGVNIKLSGVISTPLG